MKQILLTIAGLILMFGSAFSEQTDGKVFPYKYKVETLENGLKVIMINMPSKGLVAYYTIVRTGSRDECEAGHTGFAHFFEHMMFRGTKKYPANVYDGLITSMGANANAYTTDDYTCYHLNFVNEDLEKVIELESDRFQNLSYDEAGFQTESQAVLGEYNKGKTSPFFHVYEQIKNTAYDVHTYKHTTMGFEQDIKAMPGMYQYSLDFYKKYYRPENCVILVTGDFNSDNLMQLIRKYYSSWQRGYTAPNIPQEPQPSGDKDRFVNVDFSGKTLPILAYAFRGTAFDPSNKMAVAAYLLSELAFGTNSDLFKQLYLKDQKVQSFESENEFNRDPNLMFVWIMLKTMDDVDYVRDAVLKTLQKYQTTLVDDVKLNELKKRLKYQFLMNLDTPDNVAGNLARIIAITGGVDAVDTYFKTMNDLTKDDIKTAANTYFNPAGRTVALLTGK